MYKEKIEHYIRSAKKYADIRYQEIMASSHVSDSQRKHEDSQKLLRLYPPHHSVCILDNMGVVYTSHAFSSYIQSFSSQGVVTFIIGGECGFQEDIKSMYPRVSLSLLLFPHELVCIMLAEQVFRAFAIMHGSAYHKSA